MTQAVMQQAFSGGEISETLDARVGWPKYRISAAKLQNFWVDYRGGAISRPGTRFIMEAANSIAGLPWQKVRLKAFSFNIEQTYVLIFSDKLIQIIKEGAPVTSNGAVYSIITPYREEHLPQLKFEQSADVLTITHPAYPAFDLSRTADDEWTLEQITFSTSQQPPTSLSATPDVGGGSTEYVYVVTSVNSETGEESIASATASTSAAAVMSSNGNESVTVSWTAADNAGLYNVYRQVEVPNGAPAVGQLFGFVGSSKTTSYVDRNGLPNFTVTPPEHRDPFAQYGYPGVVQYFEQRKWFAASYAYPRWFVATQVGNFSNMDVSVPSRDTDAIVSQMAAGEVNAIRHMVSMPSGLLFLTGDGVHQIQGGQLDDAITPSTVRSKEKAFVGASDVHPLRIATDVLYIQEMGSQVVSLAYNFYSDTYVPTDMSVLASHLFFGHQITDWTWAAEPRKMIHAVRDDGALLNFAYLKEQDVYAWSHSLTAGQFIAAESVKEGEVSAVYVAVRRFIGCAEYTPSLYLRPDGDLYLRPDGSLYLRPDIGSSDGGRWVVYIERFDDRNFNANPQMGWPADIERAWCLDCALEYPMPAPNATLQVGQSSGTDVILTVDVPVFATGADETEYEVLATEGAAFLVTENDEPLWVSEKTIETTSSAGTVVRGGGGIADITRVLSETQALADIRRPFRNLLPYDRCSVPIPLFPGEWTLTEPTDVVTGLDHLEGMQVVGIADGNMQPAAIVVNGRYELQADATRIIVGLAYDPILETLRLDTGEPTSQGKRKKVSAVTVRVSEARGVSVYQPGMPAVEFKQRDTEYMGAPIDLQSGDMRVVLDPLLDADGKVVVQVAAGLPATILGVIPEVAIGDNA